MEITHEWRKSTKCGGAPDCAEVRLAGDGMIEIRNSAAPNTPPVALTRSEWRAFAAGVAAGEFEA